MKKLLLVGGPMGVGKTAACRLLKERVDRSVFLDGDWCWDMHPFTVTHETCAMVTENIRFLLKQFLNCSEIDTVIFCWVMHQQSIIDELTSALDCKAENQPQIIPVSLICTSEALTERLMNDIDHGIRQSDVIDRALERLTHYNELDTIKLDNTCMSVEETAAALRQLL